VSEDSTVKGARGTKSSVRSNGHQTSGGHGIGRSNNSRVTVKQNSALSRINRSRWDWSDGSNGDSAISQYQEYPKHVYNNPDKPKHYVVVNSASEEAQVLGGEEVIDDEVERVRLLAVAQVKQVKVDKRWGPAKLTKAIEEAGFDPTLNPFE